MDTYDDEGTHDFFSQHSWSDISTIDLRYHEVGRNFFTPEAFRYFFPAFLLAALNDPDEADVIVDNITFHAQRAFLDHAEYSLKAYRDFTDEQLDCLIMYLDHQKQLDTLEVSPEIPTVISAIHKYQLTRRCS